MSYKVAVDHISLFVDLDGTFLERTQQGLDPLYELINQERDKFTLVFATGRAVESVLPALNDPEIPRPDFIIADVGATIVEGKSLKPLDKIQGPIQKRWIGEEKILEAVKKIKGLEKQNVPQARRCSFLFDKKTTELDKLEKIADENGCYVLTSADRYLDFLPTGVSKGESVRLVSEHLKLSAKSLLCAGDTLNDLSFFESGHQAVAVGGAEGELVKKVKGLDNAFVAKNKGTGGILEALEDLKLIENKKPEFGNSDLVMVYHRQPFDEVRKGKEITRRLPQSPNGIIPTLLGLFSGETKGAWVAWGLHNNPNENFQKHVVVDKDKYPHLVTARVPLTTEDVNVFYKKFSKEAFWPVIFSFPSKVQIDHSHWEHFKKINRLFAEQTAAEAAKDALIWIHDYNLWLVPLFLRQLRPDVKIAFFHHTSFPTPDIFNILPWREEIIESLLQCDYIGFHIPRYVENFVNVARSMFRVDVKQRKDSSPQFLSFGCALGVDNFSSEISVKGRTIKLGAHPVGIDIERVRESYARPNVQDAYKSLLEEFRGRKAILSVERLDYVKGPIEKLEAFEHLLEKHPELHGKIVFINIVTPPAPGMDIYKQTREKLDQAVGRINGRFSRLDWTPIRYFYKSYQFEDLVAFYAASDVAWITPLRDGLNLVCKEYVFTKDISNTNGTLVLSEFAGASVELHGAILTNPFDKKNMVDVLAKAITISEDEKAERLTTLKSIVRENNVTQWEEAFLSAVVR